MSVIVQTQVQTSKTLLVPNLVDHLKETNKFCNGTPFAIISF